MLRECVCAYLYVKADKAEGNRYKNSHDRECLLEDPHLVI